MRLGVLSSTGLICAASLILMTTLTASALDLRAGVEQLVQDLIQAAPEREQLRVAVADFPDLQGITNDLGRYIASRITTRLVQSKKFSVTERQRLAQVLAELKISMSDLVDPEQAKKLKRMVGVDALVVGTIADLGKQVDVDARLIEIETNLMIGSATVAIDKDPTLNALLERGRELSGSSAGPSPPPVKDGNLAELREDHPGWVIHGNNYSLVKSKLSSQGLFTASVGDSSWENYAVEFNVKQLLYPRYDFGVLIRRQSDTDYVALQLQGEPSCGSRWVVAKAGKETVVVNSQMRYKCPDKDSYYRVEVDSNRYKLLKDGSQMFVFTNNTFANGGVGIQSKSKYIIFTIDNFKVVSLER